MLAERCAAAARAARTRLDMLSNPRSASARGTRPETARGDAGLKLLHAAQPGSRTCHTTIGPGSCGRARLTGNRRREDVVHPWGIGRDDGNPRRMGGRGCRRRVERRAVLACARELAGPKFV